MKEIAGSILVLAGAILVHAAAVDSRGYDGFSILAGIGVGILGLIIVAKNFSINSDD